MKRVGQDPYCYPNTKVLINKFGIKDEKILQEAERDVKLGQHFEVSIWHKNYMQIYTDSFINYRDVI